MINSQYTYARTLDDYGPKTRWLDIGCGHGVVPEWTNLRHTFAPLAGIDMDMSALARNRLVRWALAATAEALPFTNDSFTLVTANMVLEHVGSPSTLFSEVARVLAPGGQFVVHTPNAYGYTTVAARLVPPSLRARIASRVQDREIEDVYPTFYRANTVARLAALARAAGFRASIRPVTTSPQLAAFGPLALLERLWMRAVEARALHGLRPVLIARFEKF